MDYKVLAVQIALEAMRRGADKQMASILAKEVCDRLQNLPGSPDLMDVIMNIETVFRIYGYPAD